MDNKLLIPSINLSNISFALIIILSIIFLLLDRSIFFSDFNTALPIYFVTFISIIFVFGYLYKFGFPKSKIKNVFLCSFLYSLYIVVYSVLTSDVDGLLYVTRIIVFLSILFLFGFTILNRVKIKVVSGIFSCFTLALFYYWVQSGEVFKHSGFFLNPNTLGIVIYLILIIHLLTFLSSDKTLDKALILIVILMDVILLFVSTSRAVWIALFIGLIVFFLSGRLVINRVIYRLSFIFLLIGIFIFSYIYPKLYTMEIGWKIDTLVYKFTGKSLFTGRQEIWSKIIDLIEIKPLIGYGVSSSTSDLLTIELSAHNTYFSLLLQTGIIGLFLYCLMLYFIWDMLYPNIGVNKTDVRVLKLFPAFFYSLLVYQIFELSFVQGGYSISILEWIIVALGISLNTRQTN